MTILGSMVDAGVKAPDMLRCSLENEQGVRQYQGFSVGFGNFGRIEPGRYCLTEVS